MVEQVVPGAELDIAVNQLVRVLLANGPAALRAQKLLMKRWGEVPLAEGISAGIDAFAASYAGEEPREKMRAFLAAKKKISKV